MSHLLSQISQETRYLQHFQNALCVVWATPSVARVRLRLESHRNHVLSTLKKLDVTFVFQGTFDDR